MTGKTKNQQSGSSGQYGRYELEVERLRDENRWNKLKEYANSISTKDSKSEVLVKFCLAESDLENYLFSNPLVLTTTTSNDPGPSAASKDATMSSSLARSPSKILNDAENMFKDVISKSDKSSLSIEATILLSKLYYSQMRYDDAAKHLSVAKIHSVLAEHIGKLKLGRQQSTQQSYSQQQQQQQPFMTKTDSLRQLQIFAEAHSIKGLCLEQKRLTNLSASKSYRLSDESKSDEQDTIDSFEMSSQFAIQHSVMMHQRLQPSAINGGIAPAGQGSASTTVGSSDAATGSLTGLNNNDDNLDLINPLYEISLQKAPLLYIKRGDLQMGMRKFRELLLKKHIQSIISIRQILLKKFGECLIFNIPASLYVSPYRHTLGDEKSNSFKPSNQDEEALLCLVLSQYLLPLSKASKEVMLFRQEQFKTIREHTLNNAINSLDLLLFYLSYRRSYNVLIEKFEMTMKYSFEQFYVWYQYGLTLLCDEKYHRAYLVFKECIRMKPDHLACHLMLARIALENLYLVNDAIEWCHKVHELTGYKNKKAYIIFGCAMCFKAKLQKQHSVQISFYEQALDSFKKAHSLDPGDYLPLFHIAHCFSILRQINDAMDYVQKALKLKPDDKDSLHLLALLLTAIKNYEEAHTIMCKACASYDDYELLYTKIRIEEVVYGFNHSINSLLNLILVFKQKLYSISSSGNAASSAVSVSQSGIVSQNKNLTSANQNENWSSFESASLLNLQHTYKLNEAIGKSVTMLLQSDQLALKYGNSHSQSHNIQQVLILVRILTQIGEFYLRHDKLNDAEMCCQEIASIHPMSYLYIYLKGRIFEYKQEFLQAKLCYQNALSINPHHIQSLQQMAMVLCEMNNYHLSEKMIRDAISLNSSLPESWNILARVLDYQNDNQSALKCYQTCLQLESTNPILPFTSLTRIF